MAYAPAVDWCDQCHLELADSETITGAAYIDQLGTKNQQAG
jgi:hypothetical protein